MSYIVNISSCLVAMNQYLSEGQFVLHRREIMINLLNLKRIWSALFDLTLFGTIGEISQCQFFLCLSDSQCQQLSG